MAKRKKKGSQPTRQTKRRFGDVLASKLHALDLDVMEEPRGGDGAGASAHTSSHPEPKSQPTPRPEPAPEPIILSDEELFAQALEGMAPGDVYRGKFQGQVNSLPKPPPPADPVIPPPARSKSERARDEARAREATQDLREQALFTHVVGSVERMGAGKYHVPQRDPNRVFDSAPAYPYITEEPEGWMTPTLPKSGDGLHQVGELDPRQRELLRLAKRLERERDIPALNVRGELLDDALRQLELFIHQHWRERAKYVRVIHGKGLQSEEGVVLKPAVLRWLEGPGFRYVRGCAPELTQGGDYGSLVIALKPREDSTS